MHTKKIRLIFLLVCFSCLFLCSCGLDDYYVIDPPTANEVLISQEDQTYYRFTTTPVNALASSQIVMRGTAVYYRIYPVDQKSSLESEIASVRSSNTEYSENGINKIKNNYKRMQFGPRNALEDTIPPQSSYESWEMTINDSLNLTDDSEYLKLLTANGNVDVYVEKPSTGGEYYINAYAVTVGDVSFQPHYSSLALLGVLKFTVQ